MRVVVTESIKQLADSYFRVISEGNHDDHCATSTSQLEELRKGLIEGSLSTASYKLLVHFNQLTNQTPIFSSIDQIKIDFKQAPITEQSGEDLKEKEAKEMRRQYLRLLQEEKQYRSMIDSSMFPKDDKDNANMFNSLKYQLTVSFNMVSAILASFGMAYYISIQLKLSSSQSMIIGLVAAIGMMILEMVLFITRAVRAEDLTENEPKKKSEKKKLL